MPAATDQPVFRRDAYLVPSFQVQAPCRLLLSARSSRTEVSMNPCIRGVIGIVYIDIVFLPSRHQFPFLPADYL